MTRRNGQVGAADRNPSSAQCSVSRITERAPTPLRRGEVHLWRVGLSLDKVCGVQFRNTLSRTEQERANRFHFEPARECFITCRGLLRWLLAQYLELAPEEIRFAYGPYGKPRLTHAAGGRDLHFNLAHTRDLALVAFSHDVEVGVDVESLANLHNWSELVPRILSNREQADLERLPAAARPRAFLNGWTRKEAILKATGQGLVEDLNQIEVVLAPAQPPRLLSLWGSPTEAAKWWLAEPQLPPGLIGAVAARSGSLRLVCLA